MVQCPCVSEGRGSDFAEHVQLHCCAVCGGAGGGGGVLGDGGEAVDLQFWCERVGVRHRSGWDGSRGIDGVA